MSRSTSRVKEGLHIFGCCDNDLSITRPRGFGWKKSMRTETRRTSSVFETVTPLKFNRSPLKNGGWKITFPLGFGHFSGASIFHPFSHCDVFLFKGSDDRMVTFWSIPRPQLTHSKVIDLKFYRECFPAVYIFRPDWKGQSLLQTFFTPSLSDELGFSMKLDMKTGRST